jgi:hypothetical protein
MVEMMCRMFMVYLLRVVQLPGLCRASNAGYPVLPEHKLNDSDAEELIASQSRRSLSDVAMGVG